MSRLIGLLLVLALHVGVSHAAERPNVLFIASDDFNHWVTHLGRHPQAKTPNLDRLAARGVTFTRAYCAAPVCNASRAALMSGLRPSTTGCYDNGQNWRGGISEDKLLNTTFARAGYNVYGAGKIYHGAADRGGEWLDYFAKEGRAELEPHSTANGRGVGGIRFYPVANSDEEMPDFQTVNYGIEKLHQKHETPFFLAIGLVKPHMPWCVPRKYFDMFPLDEIELPPTHDNDLDDVPPGGIRMAKPQGDHATVVASGRWKEAVQAYLAACTFADAQVGRLLDALDQSAYRENTIICFWGDHGWHLGEKEHWRKFALWEEATRAPFIWCVPGVTKAGGVCDRTVDFMSIYPTLCDLAGVPAPSHLEGHSIRPLLADPMAEWQHAAMTTYGRENHAVRTERWRYIRYADGGEELYDHDQDPYEWTNLAASPEHAAAKAELAQLLPTSNADQLPNRRRNPGQNGEE